MEKALVATTVGLLVLLFARFVNSLVDVEQPVVLECLKLPAYLPKLECLLQLPFKDQAGLRQIAFHVTALVIFCASASLARQGRSTAERFAIMIISLPTFMAAYQLSAFYLPITESLVGSNFVSGGMHFRITRGVAVTGNPGWFWPLMVPHLALSLGLTRSRSLACCLVGMASSLTMGAAILATQQRGGYVALILLGVGTVAIKIIHVDEPRPRRVPPALSLACLIAGVSVLALRGRELLDLVGRWFGIPIRSDAISFDASRFNLWRAAFSGMPGHMWLGHGYQAWLHDFKPLAEAAGIGHLAFDTAHNLWVQLFFELGLLHGGTIDALFGVVVVLMILKMKHARKPWQLAALLLIVVAFEVTVVQEIDYINTIYYHFALVGGFVFGALGDGGDQNGAPASTPQPRKAPAISYLLYLFSFVLGCASIFAAYQYSWGGYAYEWNSQMPYPHFERWYRPSGAITAFATRQGRAFSVFPVIASFAKDKEKPLAATDQKWAAFLPDAVVVQNGSKLWGRQIRYRAFSWDYLGQSTAAMRLSEAPLQTNLGILWSHGTFPWERAPTEPEIAEKWCGKECVLALKNTGCHQASLVVYGLHPNINADHPVTIDMRALPLSFPANSSETWASKERLDALYARPASPAQMTSPEQHIELSLPPLESTDFGWLMHLRVAEVFDEKILGIAQPRELGVRLADFRCER